MDSQLLELFPGRTLEELDEMDIARLERALAARRVQRDWQHDRGYLTGENDPKEFAKLSSDRKRKIVEFGREIQDAE